MPKRQDQWDFVLFSNGLSRWRAKGGTLKGALQKRVFDAVLFNSAQICAFLPAILAGKKHRNAQRRAKMHKNALFAQTHGNPRLLYPCFRKENSAQRGSFRPDIPADIPPKTSVRASKSWKTSISERTSHADVHEKTSVWKTSGWFFVPYC